MNTRSLFRLNVVAAAAFASALVGLTGCGAPVGEVKGKVTYRNEPLKSGTVTLMSPKGAVQATIGADGSYIALNVPVGDAKVGVVCKDDEAMLKYVNAMAARGRGMGKGDGAPMPQSFGALSLIPEEYGDLEKTPFQTTVKRGKNQFDIELR